MAFKNAQSSRVLLGDFSLSSKLTTVDPKWSVDMLDTTTLADAAKTFTQGQETSTVAMKGYYDELVHADMASFQTQAQQPLTYGPQGLALSAPVQLFNTYESSFETNAGVAGVVGFSLDAQTDGRMDLGQSLGDLVAVTANGNSTADDLGAVSTANGVVAHLHVTAFSGFSGVVFTVADSANNSVFATIGTFATVAGVTGERITIAGTVRRYVRISYAVTGSGSVTYSAAFARR